MPTIDDNSALLLFRVGPVFCCAPCLPVNAIIVPTELTQPPGSQAGRPGIFKHASAIVSELELRYQFGVSETDWRKPGRVIITELDNKHIGFHVDDIQDVISMPTSGWSSLPPLLPRGIFSRTLLHKDQIYLYAEFDRLQHIPHSGYLRQYIEHLLSDKQQYRSAVDNKRTLSQDSGLRTTQTTTTVNQSREIIEAAPANKSAPTPTDKRPGPSVVTPRAATVTPQVRKPTPVTTPRQPTAATSAPGQAKATLTSTSAQTHSVLPVKAQQTSTASTRHAPVRTPAKALSAATHLPLAASEPVKVHVTQIATTQTSESNSTLLIILYVILLLGLSAGVIWYVQSLGVSHETISGPPGTSQQPSVESAQNNTSAETPVVPQAPQYTQPPSDNNTLAASSQINATNVTTPGTATSVPQPAEQTHNSGKATVTDDDYHASINKDPHGLTITLDVPPDDPAFQPQPGESVSKQAPQATVSSVEQTTAAQADAPRTATPAPAPQAMPATAAEPKPVEIIHIVVKGDTLWAIAERYVRDPFRYPELARLSKIKNPDLIYPGDRIRIIKRIRQTK